MRNAPHRLYQMAANEELAGQRCLETLLNCYCREVARPGGQASVGPLFGRSDWPQALRTALPHGQAMQLLLPHSDTRLLAVVERDSPTGNYRYCAPPYYKAPGRAWSPLDWRMLAALLIEELGRAYERPFNGDLMNQIEDSVVVTALVLAATPDSGIQFELGAPLQTYLVSEQSLHYGHPFHPAPKSREGFSKADVHSYSPEMGARFPLHYFAVRRDFLIHDSVLDEPCDDIIRRHAPDDVSTDAEFALLPVHPWQARHLHGHPLVQCALRRGLLRDHGPHGEDYFATSSIRTLFQPHNPYFYKFSLNVRVTNCVRKNAPYELEGALQVTRIVRDIAPDLERRFPDACVLEEPAYQSVDFRSDNHRWNMEVTEGFGLILREGFTNLLQDGTTPLLAGSLFGNHIHGRQQLKALVQRFAAAEGLPFPQAVERWFAYYVEQLLPPVLYTFFTHGVAFEPHLQNVVIGIRDHRPAQIFLRDFEGVKLVKERFSETRLTDISARAREALWYTDEQAWNRIGYCLFVNNFCEAIDQLTAEIPALSSRLWGVVRQQVREYQARYGDDESVRRLNALLAGQPLPAKANLINRFFKRPDRNVTYIPLPNPLIHAAEL